MHTRAGCVFDDLACIRRHLGKPKTFISARGPLTQLDGL
jgi:hypothetical protein